MMVSPPRKPVQPPAPSRPRPKWLSKESTDSAPSAPAFFPPVLTQEELLRSIWNGLPVHAVLPAKAPSLPGESPNETVTAASSAARGIPALAPEKLHGAPWEAFDGQSSQYNPWPPPAIVRDAPPWWTVPEAERKAAHAFDRRHRQAATVALRVTDAYRAKQFPAPWEAHCADSVAHIRANRYVAPHTPEDLRQRRSSREWSRKSKPKDDGRASTRLQPSASSQRRGGAAAASDDDEDDEWDDEDDEDDEWSDEDEEEEEAYESEGSDGSAGAAEPPPSASPNESSGASKTGGGIMGGSGSGGGGGGGGSGGGGGGGGSSVSTAAKPVAGGVAQQTGERHPTGPSVAQDVDGSARPSDSGGRRQKKPRAPKRDKREGGGEGGGEVAQGGGGTAGGEGAEPPAPHEGRRKRRGVEAPAREARRRPAKPPWDVHKSIFAPRAGWCDSKALLDSEDVEKQRISNDVWRACAMGLEKLVSKRGGDDELQDVEEVRCHSIASGLPRDCSVRCRLITCRLRRRQVMWECRELFVAVFTYYASTGTDVKFLFLNQWSQFVDDCRLADNRSKTLRKSDLDRLFIAVDTQVSSAADGHMAIVCAIGCPW